MRKIICAALSLALLFACAGALGEGAVTAEELLAGNSLSACLETGEYTREYVEYIDADGNVRDYNDVIYRRGETGYNMLIVYPEDSGAEIGAMLVGGNYYVTVRDGVPAYTLYASAAYAGTGSELALGADAYIAYPAQGENIELETDAEGNYILTASVSASLCDPEVVSAHGHDAAADETVYDEYVYDADMRVLSETMYYMRDGEKRVCERTTFEYAADGAAYESYAEAEGTRTISVILNPGTGYEATLNYSISDAGTVSFVLGEGVKLYSDAECTQEVPSQGNCADFAADTYYAKAG